MNGIIVDDFNLIITKNEINLKNVNDAFNTIKRDFSNLCSCINSKDLNFLINRLDLEIKEGNEIINKVFAYQKALQNVLLSYKAEDEQLASDISKLTP